MTARTVRRRETAAQRYLPAVAGRDDGRATVVTVDTGVAFLTGIEIDLPALLQAGQASALWEAVGSSEVPFVPMRASQPTKRYYSIDTPDHGTDVLPPAFVEADGAWLSDQLATAALDPSWRIVGVSMRIHDFGVGTAALTWERTTARRRRAIGPDHLADLRLLDDQTTTILEGPVMAAVGSLCRALEHHPMRLTLGPALERARRDHLPTPGELLWVWNHSHLSTLNGMREQARAAATVVCPNDFVTLDHRDHTYAPGVSASVTVSRAGSEADGRTLATTLPLQDAWWALFWSLDRLLLALHLELQAPGHLSLAELEQRANGIAAVYDRISLYRSRIDSVLVSAGARDLQVWQTLATAWNLEFRMGCVDRKLVQLNQSYGAAGQQIARSRTARMNIMIYAFTAFSVVASAVAVVEFAEGSPDGPSTLFRFAVIVAAIAIAMTAVILSLRVRIQQRRQPLLD